MPTAKGIDSVIGELGGHKDHMRTGEIAERANAQLEEEGPAYAGPDHIVYTISPTKALEIVGGEAGALVVENQPDPE